MAQQQLVLDFIEGANDGFSGNLRIQNNKLIHYTTIIAERFNGKYIVNTTRYSIVTGRIQKMLKESIDDSLIIPVHKVPAGCKDTLSKFIAAE